MGYFTIFYSDAENPLKASEKFLFGDLLVQMNNEGFFHGNLSDLPIVSVTSLSRVKNWLKILEKKGYVKVIPHENIVELLRAKNLKGLGFGNKICEWCGIKTSVLHSHHYPVPKAKGGELTVDICPNCHHEFHYDFGCIKILLNEFELSEIQAIKSDYLKSQIKRKNEI